MRRRSTIVIGADAPSWAQLLVLDLNRALTQVSADQAPPTFAKADLPTDGSVSVAIVSDEAGGVTLAFWDGTDWKRTSDNAVVS